MSHPQIEATIRRVFCNSPIMAGEDPADYQALKGLVIAEVNPQDLQQVLVTRDIVDAEWEFRRLRGMKTGILHAEVPRAIKAQIADAGDAVPFDPKLVPTIRKHVIAMVAGQPQARQELERTLEGHNLTVDIIVAAAFADTIGPQVHTDRMAAAAYERRKAAYAELERLRARKQTSKAQTLAMPYMDGEENSDAPANADPATTAGGEPSEASRNLSNGR